MVHVAGSSAMDDRQLDFAVFCIENVAERLGVDGDAALAACRLLDFPHYSNDWLDMIVSCRKGNDVADYDVIRGGVANDKVFNTCELFFRGLISRETALDRLRFESPNLQLCFKVQRAIRNCLTFIGSEIT